MTEPRSLSPRQLEALVYAAHGLSYQEIAERMGVSRAAVAQHLRWAYVKLDVRDLMGACRAMGWHRPPDVREDVA